MAHPIDPPPGCIAVGEGPPLIALPGLARTPEKSRVKFAPLARITQRRVYVINRPTGLPRELTMSDLASRHAKILTDHFSGPVDVLGASTGGAIALQMAVDHPTVINRLIIATAASSLGDESRRKLSLFAHEITRGRSGARIVASVLAPPPLQWLMTPALWIQHQFERRTNPNDMLATIDAEVAFDVTPQLGQIRSPCLLIAGGRDRAFPLSVVQSTAAAIPRCKLIVYPRCGHLGTLLNPRFGRDIAAFLAQGDPR